MEKKKLEEDKYKKALSNISYSYKEDVHQLKREY